MNLWLLDRLQAENETEWLEDVFVPPTQFDTLIGERSLVAFGESGSGKTATRLALARAGARAHLPHLIVDWCPAPPSAPAFQSALDLRGFIDQVFDACAIHLTLHICSQPGLFLTLSADTQNGIKGVIQRFVRGDRHSRLGLFRDTVPGGPGAGVLDDLINHNYLAPLPPNPADSAVIALLTLLSKRLGFQGIWIMVDGLEFLDLFDDGSMESALKAFLSCLFLFERSGFAFKLFAPLMLKPTIDGTSSVMRRRLDEHLLEWGDEQLALIVDKRIQAVTGQPGFDWARIRPRDEILDWLAAQGQSNPREWLELTRLLLDRWQHWGNAGQAEAPLDDLTWETLTRQTPAPPPDAMPLQVDLESHTILAGAKEVLNLTGKPYDVLLYLHHNRHRVCGRDELYYHAVRGLEHIPGTGDEGWEPVSSRDNNLDTVIWRLRSAIEPNPKKPTYVVSIRGTGYILRNAT